MERGAGEKQDAGGGACMDAGSFFLISAFPDHLRTPSDMLASRVIAGHNLKA